MNHVVDAYRLTPMQEGMLFQKLLADYAGVDVEQIVCKLREDLDVPALVRAWERVVACHPALRTSFRWHDVEWPVQEVYADASLSVRQEDWRELGPADQEARLGDFLAVDRQEGFDLRTRPLLRLAFFRVGDLEYWMVWTFHHIVVDGRSQLIVLKEVFDLYEALRAGREGEVSSPDLFRGHVAALASRDRSGDEEFWRPRVADCSEPTSLNQPATSRRVPATRHYGECRKEVSRETTAMLRQLARQHQLTLSTFIQAAWALLLTRYSNRDSVVFGVVRAGRPSVDGRVVGTFINTVPVRVRISPDTSVGALLNDVRAYNVSLGAREHTPLVEIQRWSGIAPGVPLFDSLLVYDEYLLQSALRRQNATWERRECELFERTGFPFTLYGYGEASLLFKFVYDEDRLDVRSAARLMDYLVYLLEALAGGLEQRVSALPVLTEEEWRLLGEWNDTARDCPRTCIHHMIEAQCERTPDAVAVAFHDEELTYRQLDRRANQFARLLQRLGVGPGTPVGVYMDRCSNMIVGLLGILKAGGYYLPLDPSYPADRISFMLTDAQVRLLVTQSHLRAQLPALNVPVVDIELSELLSLESEENVASGAGPEDLAYVIYTSGSTGKPKGVLISHRNVVNFFSGMDEQIPGERPGVWLSVTSLSFDISVLELFWTLARGFKVVLHRDDLRSGRAAAVESHIEFSLLYFASDESEPDSGDKYGLLREGARFADENGFVAVWTPERHFHKFGGLYPNPAVASAAVAAITKRVGIRAGSCVLPLHNPVRVAEDWALVDNLSGGRIGISFASGWHENDFVLKPENFEDRREIMARDIEVVRRLWRGDVVSQPGPNGKAVAVRTLPRPVQPELPVWITAAGSPETFRFAGEHGFSLLTHLLGQTIEELAEKLIIYREAWTANGHSGTGHVTLMLHTFVGEDVDDVRETVRGPMTEYLRSSVGLIKQSMHSFPALRRRADSTEPHRMDERDLGNLSEEDTRAILAFAFERYFETSGLFGTPDTCVAMVDKLKQVGVDEIACLIDFGVPSPRVLEHLTHLNELKRRCTASSASPDRSIAAEIRRHSVTHLQCTPSLATMLLASPETQDRLKDIRVLLVGGEALPVHVAKQLVDLVGEGTVINMYGPTETTIWSATHRLDGVADTVPIGRPIANTQMYVLDSALRPTPLGVPGELYIGGDGVARGYLDRPALTSERFLADPFRNSPDALLYRTGDVARFRTDGALEFLGRVDHQVKVRGHRIELGEIEVTLSKHPAVRSAVVIAREDRPGDQRLVAYVVPRPTARTVEGELREHLKKHLPDFMLPSHFVLLAEFPLTPNKKVDRKALPPPDQVQAESGSDQAPPQGAVEERIARIWQDLLGVRAVGRNANFFDLGGHSLLAVQLHRKLRDQLHCDIVIEDVFRFPSVRLLAERIGGGGEGENAAHRSSALVPMRPRGSKAPFFCVHAYRGDVLSYYNLAHHMDPDRPFYGVQAQAVGGNIASESLPEIAARYVRAIRAIHPRGPYLIGGWCFGADVALEMARQLREQHAEVPLVAMIQNPRDGHPTHRSAVARLSRMVLWIVDVVANEVNVLFALPPKARWSFVAQRARRTFEMLSVGVWRWGDPLCARLGVNLRRSDAYATYVLAQSHVRAHAEHVPKPYAGPVALFRAQRQPLGTEPDPMLGWGDLLNGAVFVQEVPGHHHGSFLWEPRVRMLAHSLSVCLDEAEAHTGIVELRPELRNAS